MITVSLSLEFGVSRRSSADIWATQVRNRSCCWVVLMMTESPAHMALGKKPLTIRYCIHIQNIEDRGCATGNLLATISRARQKISFGGQRPHLAISVGAESRVNPTDLQWNEPVTFERCGGNTSTC